MKVWVIMGNDFPAAVRLTKRGADAYVERMKAKNFVDMKTQQSGRIYWRHYEFEITSRGNRKK